MVDISRFSTCNENNKCEQGENVFYCSSDCGRGKISDYTFLIVFLMAVAIITTIIVLMIRFKNKL